MFVFGLLPQSKLVFFSVLLHIFVSFCAVLNYEIKQSAKMKWDTCYHWLSDIKTLFYDHLCLSYPHNKYDDIEMGEDLPVILSP